MTLTRVTFCLPIHIYIFFVDKGVKLFSGGSFTNRASLSSFHIRNYFIEECHSILDNSPRFPSTMQCFHICLTGHPCDGNCSIVVTFWFPASFVQWKSDVFSKEMFNYKIKKNGFKAKKNLLNSSIVTVLL